MCPIIGLSFKIGFFADFADDYEYLLREAGKSEDESSLYKEKGMGHVVEKESKAGSKEKEREREMGMRRRRVKPNADETGRASAFRRYFVLYICGAVGMNENGLLGYDAQT
ncbi:hypothetical protein PV325_008500 [Microctonus aethiopoides]|nr:hypothetical protein PV325_008500 [Microctonus aethiopoides]